MCFPAQKAAHSKGSTPNPALYCGSTASSTEPPMCPGSLPYNNHIMNCFLKNWSYVVPCTTPAGSTTTTTS